MKTRKFTVLLLLPFPLLVIFFLQRLRPEQILEMVVAEIILILTEILVDLEEEEDTIKL